MNNAELYKMIEEMGACWTLESLIEEQRAHGYVPTVQCWRVAEQLEARGIEVYLPHRAIEERDAAKAKRGYGYWKALPEGCKLAWGARAITDRTSTFELLHDRQSFLGSGYERDQFAETLNKVVLPAVRNEVKLLRTMGEMLSYEEGEFVLYSDNGVTVVGNTNGSCGYLYLLAYAN